MSSIFRALSVSIGRLNAGRLWASAPQITDFHGFGNPCHRKLTAYATRPQETNSFLWYRGYLPQANSVSYRAVFLFLVPQRLYTPVAMLRSFLPFHKCISDFIFREAVKELLECLRCIYIKTLLIYIDKVIINV